MKKTKVICSIGPSCMNEEVLQQMVLNGMDCARINLSHVKREDIENIINLIRVTRINTGVPIAIMYDTKGPEFRTLEFENNGISIKTGETIKMVKKNVIGNKEAFSVNHPEAIDYIDVGSHILIDNALLNLEVIDKQNDHIILKALNDGEICRHKTINVPGIDLNLTSISEVDKDDIAFATTHSCDYLALSFVNNKEDVLTARKLIQESGGEAMIISKIENKTGIDNIDEIISVSDGIMIARGDLGVEIPMESLPVVQKEIITKCREQGKFAIVATEMLASMYTNPRPTRAEVSDIASAVIDGTDCVMLSGETTIGKYPAESVEYMSRICEYIESTIDYSASIEYKGPVEISDTIAKLVEESVLYDNGIKMIVTATISGFTARKISNLRPNCIILAICPSSHIAEKVALNFGVKTIITETVFRSMEELVYEANNLARDVFNMVPGDKVVITGGFPFGQTRNTNFIRIESI